MNYFRKVKFNCATCGKENQKPPSQLRGKRAFCDYKCMGKFMTKPRAMKKCKICKNDFEVRECYINKRVRYSTCDKPECRKQNKIGKNNPNWKGGNSLKNRTDRYTDMTRLPYKRWRTSVFERDNFTCVSCGKRGGNMEADHIKPYAYFPELRYELSNGRTLCKKCHISTFKQLKQYATT